jgi:chromosome segregation ATPase
MLVRDTPPNPKDTMCFTIAEVQKNVSYKKALEADIEVYKDDIKILDSIIQNLTKQVAKAEQADSLGQVQVRLLKGEIQIHEYIRKSLVGQLAEKEKEIKRWKRKQFWTGVLGMAATIFMGFKWLTK